jgi:hypothetical protein
MTLAVLYTEQRSTPGWDRNDPCGTETVQVFKEFGDEAKLLEWVENNDKSMYPKRDYRVLQFQELKVERKLSIHTK